MGRLLGGRAGGKEQEGDEVRRGQLGAREPEVTEMPCGSQPGAAHPPRGGNGLASSRKTLQGSLWQVLPTRGLGHRRPYGPAWPVPLGTEPRPPARSPPLSWLQQPMGHLASGLRGGGEANPWAARSDRRQTREDTGTGQEPGAHRAPGRMGVGWVPGGFPLGGAAAGAGVEPAWLTSWEISRCFLAKVRACAGLPMDT